jgi:hypothetical protein
MMPSPFVQCELDTDCTAGVDGRCTRSNGCSCTYDECASDAACATGQLCDCRDAWDGSSTCLPTNCRTDSDCGSCGYCSPTFGSCGKYEGVTGWACHTAQDTCTNDSDCQTVDGGFVTAYCAYQPELGHWACSISQCSG